MKVIVHLTTLFSIYLLTVTALDQSTDALGKD